MNKGATNAALTTPPNNPITKANATIFHVRLSRDSNFPSLCIGSMEPWIKEL
jgi:hypothetical protein